MTLLNTNFFQVGILIIGPSYTHSQCACIYYDGDADLYLYKGQFVV